MPNEYSSLDIEVSKFTLTSHVSGAAISLDDFAANISIQESVFENTLEATITMSDSLELTETLPIIGGEVVELVFRTDKESPRVSYKFIVTNVLNKTMNGENTQNYVLECASEELLRSETQRVSKSFKNKKASDIVRTMFGLLDSPKRLHTSQTKNIHHFIAPYWTPLKVINWCCSIAKDTTYESASYVFFESSDGFHFTTLEGLLNQDASASLVYDFNTLSENPNQNEDTITIDKFRFASRNDLIGMIADGVTGSTVVSFDPVVKDYSHEEQTFTQMMDTFRIPGNGRFQNSDFEYFGVGSRFSVVPTKSHRRRSNYVRQSGDDDFSSFPEVAVKTRSPFLSLMTEAIVLEVEIGGETSLSAGKVVDVTIPLISGLDDIQGQDSKTVSGKYLIVESVDSITWSRNHTKTLSLVKINYEREPKGTLDV